jgi:aminoglycoside 6'-N-acetyltransferase I
MKELTRPEAQGVVLFAETEEGLAGFAEISVRHDHVEGSSAVPIPYLEGWYVDAAHRSQGIGKSLLHHAERWAMERGFSELASDAEMQNETSIATHLACGFREAGRSVHFIKRLR